MVLKFISFLFGYLLGLFLLALVPFVYFGFRLVEILIHHSNYSNCFLWALRQNINNGGYVAFRWSKYGWFPHVLYSLDLIVWSAFVPKAHPSRLRYRIFPPLFKGEIKQDAK